MNTGIAYMEVVSLQRLNSEGKVLYEEKFSILDPFGSYEKLSKRTMALLSLEDAQKRYQDFILFLKEKVESPFLIKLNLFSEEGDFTLKFSPDIDSGVVKFYFFGEATPSIDFGINGDLVLPIIFFSEDSLVDLNFNMSASDLLLTTEDYIKEDVDSCPIPSENWELSNPIVTNTTLKEKIKGSTTLKTSFDKVGVVKERSYDLEFLLIDDEVESLKLDYQEAKNGELIFKSEIPRKELVFDINKNGELIVIGEDADHYFLNELGQLYYKY